MPECYDYDDRLEHSISVYQISIEFYIRNTLLEKKVGYTAAAILTKYMPVLLLTRLSMKTQVTIISGNMKISGTQIRPSKPKREIANITNSQNTN